MFYIMNIYELLLAPKHISHSHNRVLSFTHDITPLYELYRYRKLKLPQRKT